MARIKGTPNKIQNKHDFVPTPEQKVAILDNLIIDAVTEELTKKK